MPMKTSAKDFFLNLGIIVSLYTVVFNIINLAFTVINKAYPQITNGYYYPSTYSISFPVATLIIFFPIFILLSWLLGKDFVTMPAKKNLGVHKWLTYITLFLAGLGFAGDLVSVLYYFIDGQELTTGFLLKALVVLVISGLIFYYYISDIRRVLSSKEKMIWRIIACVVVAGSIVWGFSVLGSPRTQQLLKYDEQKVNDLQNINSQIQNFYQLKNKLPATLNDVIGINGYYGTLPVDEQTGQAYEYRITSSGKYELCANFNLESPDTTNPSFARVPGALDTLYTWEHSSGHYCFTRISPIDIQSFSKPTPAY